MLRNVLLVILGALIGWFAAVSLYASKTGNAQVAEIDAKAQLQAANDRITMLQNQPKQALKTKDESEYWKNLYYGEQNTVANLESQINNASDPREQWTTAAQMGGCMVAIHQLRATTWGIEHDPQNPQDLIDQRNICLARLEANIRMQQTQVAQPNQMNWNDWLRVLEIVKLLLH